MLIEAIISVVSAVLLAELAKAVLRAIRGEPLRFFELGGMPSAHAASVAALFLAVYIETGFSLLLLVCAVFGYIVIRDAYGARWEVSRHSAALNKLLKTKAYSTVGHRELEVLAGFALGLAVTLLVYWIW